MGDDVVPFGEDHVIFVAECVGKAANEIEQAIAARRNMGAVLDVPLRPEALRGSVVAFVEQRVEGFEHECLVLFGRCGGHVVSTFPRRGAPVYEMLRDTLGWARITPTRWWRAASTRCRRPRG